MPQETKSAPAPIETASLAGLTAELTDPETTRDILHKAFDYRGDVTLTLDDGSTIAGYLFNRTLGATLDASHVQLLPPDSDQRATIPYSRICSIAFSDRDPAAGKSFETWVRKYVEKKLKGEKASIESDTLD